LNTLKSPSKKQAPFIIRWFGGWLPLWLCTGLIIKGAVLEPSKLPTFLAYFDDKLIHGAEFFLLFLFAIHAFRLAKSAVFRHSGVMAFAYCMFVGVLTEAAQFYVQSRSPDVYDLLADTAGIAAGFCVYGLVRYCSYTRYQKRAKE